MRLLAVVEQPHGRPADVQGLRVRKGGVSKPKYCMDAGLEQGAELRREGGGGLQELIDVIRDSKAGDLHNPGPTRRFLLAEHRMLLFSLSRFLVRTAFSLSSSMRMIKDQKSQRSPSCSFRGVRHLQELPHRAARLQSYQYHPKHWLSPVT
jgi:hypothetical protein